MSGKYVHNFEPARAVQYLMDESNPDEVISFAKSVNKDEEWADVEPYVTEGWVLLRKKD